MWQPLEYWFPFSSVQQATVQWSHKLNRTETFGKRWTNKISQFLQSGSLTKTTHFVYNRGKFDAATIGYLKQTQESAPVCAPILSQKLGWIPRVILKRFCGTLTQHLLTSSITESNKEIPHRNKMVLDKMIDYHTIVSARKEDKSTQAAQYWKHSITNQTKVTFAPSMMSWLSIVSVTSLLNGSQKNVFRSCQCQTLTSPPQDKNTGCLA